MKQRRIASLVRGFGPALLLWLPICNGWAASLPVGSLPMNSQPTISAARQHELVFLVRNDCGSCHGLSLKGGLGTPLTPDALAGKPDEALRETILRGRTGTAMPGWSDFMNASEAQWVVEQLKAGFPNAR
jgi:cytochrome c55X